jgi:hypothetical protein
MLQKKIIGNAQTIPICESDMEYVLCGTQWITMMFLCVDGVIPHIKRNN